MNSFQKKRKEIREFSQKNLIIKWLTWILVLCFPVCLALAVNYLSYGSGEKLVLLLRENAGSFLFGVFLISMVFLALSALLPKVAPAAGLTALLFLLLSLVDYFKFSILKEHFLPWDLLLAKNAGSFTEFLNTITISPGVIAVLVFVLLYCILLFFMGPSLPIPWRFRAPFCPLLLALVFVFVTTTSARGIYEKVFSISLEESGSQSDLYEKHGFLTAFVLNFHTLSLTEPQNYSKSYLELAFADYAPDPASGEDFQNPDIIVVLSEAFWDPTVLNGVTFSADPLGNFRTIAENNPSGKMVSPTFGGGTVRPEFEILTGMSTSALPTGNIPYQQYVKRDIFSFTRQYKNLGYDALGIHTYQKTFYDRDKAYPLMGFDAFLGEYDLHADHHWNSGPYITDETIAEEIIYQLEQPRDVGLFLAAITMENHSMYQDKYDPADWDITVSGDNLSEAQKITLQNYAKGVSDSDHALKAIYDYVMEREKPTVVLWYGDHLPTLGDNFDPYTTTGNISVPSAAQWNEEEKFTMFSTPYLIFANYDTGREYHGKQGESVSPYLLPALMADYIGAPESIQTNFLLELYDTCPVISKYYSLYTPGKEESKREEMRKLHELWTYDELIGKQYLSQADK